MTKNEWQARNGTVFCNGVEVGQFYSSTLAYAVVEMLAGAESAREALHFDFHAAAAPPGSTGDES